MLHILNGDSSANTLRLSVVPGEHLAWQEALIDGPVPSGLSSEDWRRTRAKHLSEAYGGNFHQCEQDLLRQEQALSTFPKHDEVVLWFEHDLFCQTNLLYLLNWFADRELGDTKLSLICVGEVPGIENFRGLGQLSAEQMTSLFPKRHKVSPSELKLATAAWQAYCSPDPTAIEGLLNSDTSTLPFLKDALQHHLQRFPSVRNGLGRIENRGLEFIHTGLAKFIDVFKRFCDAEPVYGLGDFQFWLAMRQISEASEPLLTMKNGGDTDRELNSERIAKTSLEITEVGHAVLQGQANFVEINRIDMWLGGVHLSNKNLWQWDDKDQKIVPG